MQWKREPFSSRAITCACAAHGPVRRSRLTYSAVKQRYLITYRFNCATDTVLNIRTNNMDDIERASERTSGDVHGCAAGRMSERATGERRTKRRGEEKKKRRRRELTLVPGRQRGSPEPSAAMCASARVCVSSSSVCHAQTSMAVVLPVHCARLLAFALCHRLRSNLNLNCLFLINFFARARSASAFIFDFNYKATHAAPSQKGEFHFNYSTRTERNILCAIILSSDEIQDRPNLHYRPEWCDKIESPPKYQRSEAATKICSIFRRFAAADCWRERARATGEESGGRAANRFSIQR